MEAFINRWLWLMSLNDIRKLKESIQKQSLLLTSTSAAQSTAANLSSTQTQQQKMNQSTSPSELPPPSPASSIGSSAGSVNGNNTAAQHSSHGSNVQSVNDPISQQQSQFELMQKMLGLHERYIRFNDYIIRSQNFWDMSEQLINENDYLNGLFTYLLAY